MIIGSKFHKTKDNQIYSIPKEELERLYETRSQRQIGQLFGLSRTAVSNLLDRLGIQRRSYQESSSVMNLWTFPGFTPQQEQLVYGSLLGDACLHRTIMRSNKREHNKLEIYRLQFQHGIDQKAYLEHKRSILPGSKIKEYVTGFGRRAFRYYFCHTPTLREVAKWCHDGDHKKRVSQGWLDKLTWEGIAYWFQDDGYTTSQRGYPVLGFCTNSYSDGELDLLQRMLMEKFGLETRRGHPGRNPNATNRYRLIARYYNQIAPFLERLSPFINPCLHYKLNPFSRDKPPAPSESL